MCDYLDYEQTDSVASYTQPIMGGRVKKGTILLVQGKYACRVVEIDIAKTGKHGSAKASFVGLDIFNGHKHEMLTTTHSRVAEVVVKRQEYLLLDITDDGFLSLMRDDGEVRHDLELPPKGLNQDTRGRIETMFDMGKDVKVTVMAAMGKEMPVDAKLA